MKMKPCAIALDFQRRSTEGLIFSPGRRLLVAEHENSRVTADEICDYLRHRPHLIVFGMSVSVGRGMAREVARVVSRIAAVIWRVGDEANED